MAINTAELSALPLKEKLQIVEMLWDELGELDCTLPLPDWVAQEAGRRREELTKAPESGLAHDEVWRRICTVM